MPQWGWFRISYTDKDNKCCYYDLNGIETNADARAQYRLFREQSSGKKNRDYRLCIVNKHGHTVKTIAMNEA